MEPENKIFDPIEYHEKELSDYYDDFKKMFTEDVSIFTYTSFSQLQFFNELVDLSRFVRYMLSCSSCKTCVIFISLIHFKKDPVHYILNISKFKNFDTNPGNYKFYITLNSVEKFPIPTDHINDLINHESLDEFNRMYLK